MDRFAPAALVPYLRLARADRPIGFFLLALPCFWSVSLAGRSLGEAYPDPWLLLLFAVGALVMRGAGCTYNDLIDRDLDAKVARTRGRPLPSGQVSPRAAIVFMLALCLIGLAVLLSFNSFTVWLGLGVLPIVALYPFVKRFSHWPQAVLGLAFNWGALLGWPAVLGRLDWPAIVLYAGAVCWTIGYDTIYAHQDREDDDSDRAEIDRAQIRPRHQGLARPPLRSRLARHHCGGNHGACRHGVSARHDGGGGSAWLAGLDPRHRRSGELPRALPLESRLRRSWCSAPSFSTWPLRQYSELCGSRLTREKATGPQSFRPEARMTPCC